ncbi:hypothetical protein PV08_02605 [Exophiala spinifera]|uniref:Tyrosine specific protein phosphatases domain-containing protein n=1 Tax=Exophiala spinifera TaxID=91928 RepID=A0A0D2A008_9EURO|nr:uncharacterized protein PV08_02605 [Exophiala spinifera]KIW18317.1 hypothetical protein PV08_02605 [Exophiala spinifera]
MDKYKQTFATLINSPVNEDIPGPILDRSLSSTPFVPLKGAFNTRDIGIKPYLQPGLIYRSGSLAGLGDEGKDHLTATLGVQTVFDFRSAGERNAFPFPSIEGVQILSLPSDSPAAANLEISDFVSLESDTNYWEGGCRGWSKEYQRILTLYKQPFRKVLEHLLNNPGVPILFNCTAGRDRTGVLAALLLSLAGVPDEHIAFEYALSRVGVEVQKNFLAALVKKWKPEWTEDTPGIEQFSNTRAEYMERFLQDIRNVYHGEEGGDWGEIYALHGLGFTMDEVQKIRNNIKGQ